MLDVAAAAAAPAVAVVFSASVSDHLPLRMLKSQLKYDYPQSCDLIQFFINYSNMIPLKFQL